LKAEDKPFDEAKATADRKEGTCRKRKREGRNIVFDHTRSGNSMGKGEGGGDEILSKPSNPGCVKISQELAEQEGKEDRRSGYGLRIFASETGQRREWEKGRRRGKGEEKTRLDCRRGRAPLGSRQGKERALWHDGAGENHTANPPRKRG